MISSIVSSYLVLVAVAIFASPYQEHRIVQRPIFQTMCPPVRFVKEDTERLRRGCIQIGTHEFPEGEQYH